MNLLHDPWMPVRDAAGQRHWITPDRLGERQWRAFDADRPDFNGALAQFAIGLLQTTTQVANLFEWRALLNTPPDSLALRQWFEPLAAAFELDGDGRRFMQDAELAGQGADLNEISGLLIESPGDNTVKNNADLFVKRSRVAALCPACAAIALFTLQLNAPSGGAGNRTGVRGGGPLTTLVLAPAGGALWHDLWMNVSDRPSFLARAGDAAKDALHCSLPWLAPITALQPEKGELAQIQVHPAHVFWAMPRRILLETGVGLTGRCGCCGRSSQELISRYRAKNHGLNYKGSWLHPLSPYYEAKEGWLPVHPQPDGLGYRHWLGWVLGAAGDKKSVRVAQAVDRVVLLPPRQTGGQLRLWAFGYDMDNMKARCWYDATLPLYGLGDADRNTRQYVQAEVARWLAGAELASQALRAAVKDAWFSADARGEFGHVDASFWGLTEAPFYRHLQALIDSSIAGMDTAELPAREAWHATIVRTAIRLFDQNFVGAGAIERQNPRRIALAHRQLLRSLNGDKLRLALGLPVDESKIKPKSARKSASKSTNGPAREAT